VKPCGKSSSLPAFGGKVSDRTAARKCRNVIFHMREGKILIELLQRLERELSRSSKWGIYAPLYPVKGTWKWATTATAGNLISSTLHCPA
jgi:hypothetical protein